jgi:hypothetical protein
MKLHAKCTAVNYDSFIEGKEKCSIMSLCNYKNYKSFNNINNIYILPRSLL